jgi:hypothetical protein
MGSIIRAALLLKNHGRIFPGPNPFSLETPPSFSAAKNVTNFVLIWIVFAPHVVCPQRGVHIILLLAAISSFSQVIGCPAAP